MSRSERRRGRGAAGLTELARMLSERDFAVLDAVAEHRFLTTGQVQAFLFPIHASVASASRNCRRVLQRLAHLGLLERPIRRVGGLQAGSTSSVWMLTSAGQRLRSLRSGDGAVGRVREPGERFVQHYLAIADTHVALVAAEQSKRLELLMVQIEPACWRSYSGLGGAREVLKPDLYVVTASGQYEAHWFIEVDRATESLPTLLRQCQQYERYRRSGREQVSSGLFPYVLWVVPDDIRALKLHNALNAARRLDRRQFKITTPNRLVDHITEGEA